MARVRLAGGPADGMLCELGADTAWITVLDGQPVILPSIWDDQRLRDVLNKARGDWAYYAAEPIQPPFVPVYSYRGHSGQASVFSPRGHCG